MDTPLTVPFAHTIEPTSIEMLMDEVGTLEWLKRGNEVMALSAFAHRHGGGASYYVVFLDPLNKTLDHIINADLLYKLFDTKLYNEEIHLITLK